MTKILYRYILREITYPFILALFVATFALMMGKILQLMELVINKGVGFWNILKLILFMMPGLLLFTIPLAFLIAILMGIGRLSRDNEWTVMKNAGLSLYQLSRPVFALAVVAFVMTASMTLGMPVKFSRPARKPATATSFAALTTAGTSPPACAAACPSCGW